MPVRNRLFGPDATALGGCGAALRRWTIPVVGGVTPVLLIVINIAEFITKHLEQFRWAVTGLAFVSGLMFNSYFTLNAYRLLARRFPNSPLVSEANQELGLVLGMAGVIVASGGGAYALWLGLADASNLPNKETFLYGALSIMMPIVIQEIVRRFVRRDAVPS